VFPKFLHAGPSFGGSCFPKDTVALIKTAQDAEAPLRIVETVAAVNDARKRGMARKVAAAFGSSLRGESIALLGLTFKPNTDDMREAPSIPLITALTDMGARVRAYDPLGMGQAKQVLGRIKFSDDPYACAKGADALVIVPEWEQFRALDFERLSTVMKQPALVDRPEDIEGFAYHSVERPDRPGSSMASTLRSKSATSLTPGSIPGSNARQSCSRSEADADSDMVASPAISRGRPPRARPPKGPHVTSPISTG
jgi:UDPglucose 6-dehydrogenase